MAYELSVDRACCPAAARIGHRNHERGCNARFGCQCRNRHMYSLRHDRITMGWGKPIPEKHRFRTLTVGAYCYQPPHLEHSSGLVERIPLRPRKTFPPRSDSAAAANRDDDPAGKSDSPRAAYAASAKGARPGPPGRRSAGSRARNLEQIRSSSDIREPPCRPYDLPVRVLQDEL